MSQAETPAPSVYRWSDAEVLGVVGLLTLIGFLNVGVLATLAVWSLVVYGVWFLRVNA